MSFEHGAVVGTGLGFKATFHKESRLLAMRVVLGDEMKWERGTRFVATVAYEVTDCTVSEAKGRTTYVAAPVDLLDLYVSSAGEPDPDAGPDSVE